MRIKNFTIDLLDFLLGLPEGILGSFDRRDFYSILHGMSEEKMLTTNNICKIFNNLKRSGYIETQIKNGTESIRFTNKSRLAIIDRVAMNSEEDKTLRFVSFDIPEQLRVNRDRFRRTIKRLGFRQIQKSLWVSNKNIGDFVEIAATEYGVNDYVVYIAAQNTNITKLINQILNN